MDPTFAELLRLARLGDPEAVERIVHTYEKDVRIAARVHLGPALRPYLDSIDLVQSVHRSLLVGLRTDRFDIANPGSLIALALTIVRRKISRQWRRHRKQSRQEIGSGVVDPLLAGDSPERVASTREAIVRLWRECDLDDRRHLELLLNGWTTREAAEHLGKSPELLRVRLHRFRQRLRESGVLNEWAAGVDGHVG